ncbi:hypothetical protein WJX73_009849 [Symbiochloris irregularis]|uniref:Uncharacterized protein n=1 Tax=Symbiochloris irregularis TaxID=706552 RepID=A0AAW1P1Q9_9CHLO
MNAPICRALHSYQDTSTGAHTEGQQQIFWHKILAGLSAAVVVGACTLHCPPPAQAMQIPFLQANGARGPLAEEEARLLRLRQEAEGPLRDELKRARSELEKEGRATQYGKLCATPFGIDVVGITELIALTGAIIGGVTSKQRKDEVEALNDQLRKINLNLRQQARVSTIYTPGLNFAQRNQPSTDSFTLPPGMGNGQSAPANGESAAVAVAPQPRNVLLSMDEDEQSPEVRQCVSALREGKRLLREKQGASAMVRFEKAHMLAKGAKEALYERRSVRGLAAAARLQGQHKTAIQHLKRVLEISKTMGDHVGDADAYGTIADIYTDIGQFEKAAKYYDRYIETMNSESVI